MKIVNDKGSGITPYAGCVCSHYVLFVMNVQWGRMVSD